MLEHLNAWAHAWGVMVREAIAHRVAGPQLERLRRFEHATDHADRWLASYPQSILALQYVRDVADGRTTYAAISAAREEIQRHASAHRVPEPGLGHEFSVMREALAEHNRMVDARQHHQHQLPAQRRRRDDGPMVKQ